MNRNRRWAVLFWIKVRRETPGGDPSLRCFDTLALLLGGRGMIP